MSRFQLIQGWDDDDDVKMNILEIIQNINFVLHMPISFMLITNEFRIAFGFKHLLSNIFVFFQNPLFEFRKKKITM